MSQQINLFNPALVKKRSMLTSTNLVVLVVLLVVVFAGFGAVFFWKATKLKQTAVQSDAHLKALQSELQLAQTKVVPRTEDPKLLAELEQLRRDLADTDRVELFLGNDQSGNVQGYSEFFKALARQVPDKLWITGFQIDGDGTSMSISGRASLPEQVPIFVNQLKREKIMQGRAFSALKMQRPQLENTSTSLVNSNEKKVVELAPYVEFDLHTVEQKEKKETIGSLR